MSAPPILQPRRMRLSLPLLGVVAVAAATVVLFLFDPSRNGFYPRCLLYVSTGIYCPGCGGLRAVHSLVHGDVLAALHFNALFVLSIPFVCVYGVRQFSAMMAGRRPPQLLTNSLAIKILVSVVVLFTILRNIPMAPFMYLAPGP
jgi:hypothetical protein